MEKDLFTQIIKEIPSVNYGISGLEVHRSHTKEGTMYFVAAHEEVEFPTHQHAEQWTIVLSGNALIQQKAKQQYIKRGTRTQFLLILRTK